MARFKVFISPFTTAIQRSIISSALFVAVAAYGAEIAESTDTVKGKDLKEVEIVYETVKRDATQDLVTITQAMRKGSNNAGELLGRLEGMRYDKLSGTLSYMGSSKVKILVDSIERDESYIKRLRHNRFNKIDVIYQPSGEYFGYDVLINLRTNPNYQGYEGYLFGTASLITGDRNGKGNALTAATGNGAFDYFAGKLSLSGQLYYDRNRNAGQRYTSDNYLLNGIEETNLHRPRNNPGTVSTDHKEFANFSADYRFNNRNSMSVVYRIQNNKTETNENQNLIVNNYNTNTSQHVNLHTHYDNTNNISHYAGAVYRGQAGLWNYGAKLFYRTAGFDTYNTIWRSSGYYLSDNRHTNFEYTYAQAYLRHSTANRKWTFLLNYKNIWQHYQSQRLETGLNLTTLTNISNDLSLQAKWNISNSTGISAAIQMVQYSNNSDGIKESKISPAGLLNIYHAFSRKIWIRGNYLASYSSPTASQSYDYGQFTDSLTWNGGNPYLTGTLSHTGKITVGIAQMITVQAMVNGSPNSIEHIYSAGYGMRPDGITGPYVVITPQNFKYFTYGFMANWQKRIKAWDLSAGASVTSSKYTLSDMSQKYTNFDCSVECTYNLFKYNFQASLTYNTMNNFVLSPQYLGKDHNDRTTLSLSQSLLNGHLSIDFFYTFPFHFTSGKAEYTLSSPALNQHIWGTQQYITDNMFRLNLTYRFWGGGRVRKYNDKNIQEVEM